MSLTTSMKKDNRLAQFVRFIVSGGAAALANFGSRFLFGIFLPYLASIILAFFVGLLVGFFLMRSFVFSQSRRTSSKQAYYFVLVNLIGLVVTVAVSLVVARFAGWFVADTKIDEAIGHLTGVCAPVLLSFYAHKYVTFR
jgi:putative flippase GtrA